MLVFMHFELVFCQKSSKTHILIKLEILFEILAILGPDHLESTILKIQVIYNLTKYYS